MGVISPKEFSCDRLASAIVNLDVTNWLEELHQAICENAEKWVQSLPAKVAGILQMRSCQSGDSNLLEKYLRELCGDSTKIESCLVHRGQFREDLLARAFEKISFGTNFR